MEEAMPDFQHPECQACVEACIEACYACAAACLAMDSAP
jgi:hypothetical protein